MDLKEKISRYCSNKLCNTCETCIYDEENIEETLDKLNKKNMDNKENLIPFSYAYCNECPHAQKTEVMTTYKTNKYVNWFCGKAIAPYSVQVGSVSQRSIELSALDTKKVAVPYWCPIKSKVEKTPIKEVTKSLFKDLPYYERREKWAALKTITKWEDIEVNKVYHLPPLIGETRKDILITSKSEYSIGYKNLTTKVNYSETMYPSTLMVKFLVPHKIKDIKIIEK